LSDAGHVAERDPEVYGGELALEAFAVAFDEAAGDDDLPACASLLVLERFRDCSFRFPNRGLEKGAGGDDDEVRRARVGCQAVAGLGQRAEDVLGINLVLRTAEEDEASGITNSEFLMTNQ
jgi:hypothetical protein